MNKLPAPRPFARTGGPAPGPVRALRQRLCTRPGGRRVGSSAALLALACGALAQPAPAVPPAGTALPPAGNLSAEVQRDVQQLMADAARTLLAAGQPAARVEVVPGQLDARLRLAPCTRIEAFLPAGSRPLGATRVGLRCRQAPASWSVTLPVTVRLWGRALVARSALPAGTVLDKAHLAEHEVDLAASTDPAITQDTLALGRTLARGLAPGETLRQHDLRLRQWFSAGDVVQIVASGPGFAIRAEGQALAHGFEGQPIRVRIDGGQVVSGMPSGVRRVEVGL